MSEADQVLRGSTPRRSTGHDAREDGSRTDDAAELRRRIDGVKDVFDDVIVIHRRSKPDAPATSPAVMTRAVDVTTRGDLRRDARRARRSG